MGKHLDENACQLTTRENSLKKNDQDLELIYSWLRLALETKILIPSKGKWQCIKCSYRVTRIRSLSNHIHLKHFQHVDCFVSRDERLRAIPAALREEKRQAEIAEKRQKQEDYDKRRRHQMKLRSKTI